MDGLYRRDSAEQRVVGTKGPFINASLQIGLRQKGQGKIKAAPQVKVSSGQFLQGGMPHGIEGPNYVNEDQRRNLLRTRLVGERERSHSEYAKRISQSQIEESQ